ncbi:VCBS repeat-containing protein [Streptomyces sp. NPDC004787]|uniref:FG-GAP repeat domain-containing protein n=1 Tax=Streptomyces sp. NPDC004787 TaxID=3154291 RepID=UPI0033B73AE6
MSHVRPARRRLAVAVATVVAVTVGATALTAPANATPAAGTREADADATDVARFPANAGMSGVGESGYLIWVHGTPIATDHWLPKDGSAMTEVKGAYSVDYTGSGDLVATDTAGVMWLYKGTGSWSAPYKPRVKIGTGWNGYNQITATGNIAGGAAGDLVARDASGVLWLYLGKGDGTFAPRVRIGAGWGGYGNLVGIGDINHDGRPDLYAANSADHDTYVYKGTGSWSAPFSPRQAIYVPNNWPTAVA